MSLEEMNQASINMALGTITEYSDASINGVRKLYDNIRNDYFLLAKCRLEIILFLRLRGRLVK